MQPLPYQNSVLRPIARMLLLVQVAALALVIAGAVVLGSIGARFQSASAAVEKTQQILEEIEAIRTEVLRSGLALRNYAIAPDPLYLDRTRQASRRAIDAAHRLEELVQGDREQAFLAFTLRSEASEIVGWLASSTVIAERDGPEALIASLRPQIAEDSAKVLRKQLADLETEERLRLQSGTAERLKEYKRLTFGAAAVGATFAAFLLWSIFTASTLFRRSRASIQGLKDSADLDPLTSLLNRRALHNRFEAQLKSPLTVLTFDLDDFKPVNDVHGHKAGDEVLHVTAKRLIRECRDDDLIARVGGDEFVVVLTGVADERTANRVCDRLKQALSEPIQLDAAAVRVGISLGHVVSPGGVRLADLLSEADSRAYAEKRVRKTKGLSLVASSNRAAQ